MNAHVYITSEHYKQTALKREKTIRKVDRAKIQTAFVEKRGGKRERKRFNFFLTH